MTQVIKLLLPMLFVKSIHFVPTTTKRHHIYIFLEVRHHIFIFLEVRQYHENLTNISKVRQYHTNI